ncbi:MAG: DUF5011 domain-containing protein, partial [Verrucomicrobiae bacterium]|nr:DUF5011 domain-containing protein [Verrucomicrobiae bacterium]
MKRVPTTKSYAFVSRFGGWTEGIRPAFQCLAGVAGLMLGLAATPAQAAPEITVQRFGGQTFVDNDAHDDQLNDGTVFLQARAVNVGTDRVTIEIRNDGTTDLTGISVGLSGADADQFALNTDDLVTTLSPAQTTTFDIDFAPTRTGRFSVQLAIQSNDGDESPFDLLVRGEGVDLPDPTLVVDLADDEDDGNFGAGDLSFREALKLADAAPDLTTILFSPRLNGVPISPENHDWNVGSAVNIVGNGAPATILDGQNLLRVLSFQDQGGLAYDATIQGVTIRNGNASDGPGGGLYSTIRLTVADCLVTNNTSQSGDGGGIFNFGNLTVTGSTIASNSAPAGNGGGIEQGNGTLTLQNCTVTGNSANNGGGINQNGNGAILNGTIVSNTAATSGGGLRINGGAPSLDNTIVAGNTATGSPSDILIPFGNFASGSGHNLIGDPATAGGLGHGTDGNILGNGSGGLRALGAIVGPLSNLGGGTTVRPLVSGSPAIDHGDNIKAADLTTDQRGTGFDRVVGGTVDIGAFERGAGTGGGNTPPSVTLTGANPLTFEAASRYTDPGATAFDLEDGNRTPRITANDVNPRVPGAYSVTWTATDSGGLTGTATRTVNVVDTTPPAIANRKTVTANATSAAGATVNFTLPGATDIVGVTSIVASPPSGSQFPIGTTPVSVTAMDAAGNTSMSTFDVVVRLVDGSPPVIRLTSPTGRS